MINSLRGHPRGDDSVLLRASNSGHRGITPDHPDYHERITAGALVLFASTVTFLGWALGIMSLTSSVLICVAVGLVLAVGTYWIDRGLSSPSADDERVFVKTLGRAAYALAGAYAVAHLLLLVAYDPEIDAALEKSMSQRIAALQPSPSFQRQIAALEAPFRADAAQASRAARDLQVAISQRDAECSGRGGTMQPGDGKFCKEKTARVTAAQAEATEAAARVTAQKPLVDQQVVDIKAKAEASLATQIAAIRGDDGLLARQEALGAVLDSKPHARKFALGLEVFLISVDLTPLLYKLSRTKRTVLAQSIAAARKAAGARLNAEAEADAAALTTVLRATATDREAAFLQREMARVRREAQVAASTQPARRRGLALITGAAVLAGLAFFGGVPDFTANNSDVASPVPAATTGPANSLSRTFVVTPNAPLDLQLPGLARITAPVGSVSREGSVTVTPARTLALPNAKNAFPVRRAAEGVDVTFNGTDLVKQATVSYPVAAPPASGALPVVMHRKSDGTWERLAARYASGQMTIRTQSFSPNIPGWGVAADVADWLVDRVAATTVGKTTEWACENSGPYWASIERSNDIVHACVMSKNDGTGRAEVRIKGDFGAPLQIDVEGNSVDFIWVEGQEQWLRTALASLLGGSGDRTVFLPAGQKISVGLNRPTGNLTVNVKAATNVKAMAVQVVATAIDALIGEITGFAGVLGTSLYALQECIGGVSFGDLSFFQVPDHVRSLLSCALHALPGIASDAAKSAKLSADAKDILSKAGPVADAIIARSLGQTVGSTVGNWLVTHGRIDPAQAVAIYLTGSSMDSLPPLAVGNADGSGLGQPYNPQSGSHPQSEPIPVATGGSTSGGSTGGSSGGSTTGGSTTGGSTSGGSSGGSTTGGSTTGGSTSGGSTSGGSATGGGSTGAAPATVGFTIQDIFYEGTWARTDTSDGRWYPRSQQPSNASYWYPNGLGVGVDCATTGASYRVRFADGHYETWSTWFHVTDGKYFPSAAAKEVNEDGFQGLPAC